MAKRSSGNRTTTIIAGLGLFLFGSYLFASLASFDPRSVPGWAPLISSISTTTGAPSNLGGPIGSLLAGYALFLFGGALKGGLIGQHPSLTKLHRGDLVHHTDFRSVYGTLLDRRLKTTSTPALGRDCISLALLRACGVASRDAGMSAGAWRKNTPGLQSGG
jgi:hypothetical protein